MRCYFLWENKIEFVDLFQPGSDEHLIRQPNELFRKRIDARHILGETDLPAPSEHGHSSTR
jgi:hypothetical protein